MNPYSGVVQDYKTDILRETDAEDYFVQYVFCCMERALLRSDHKHLYERLLCVWLEVWQGLQGYVGEDKIKLCGDIFKSKITKGERHDNKVKVG